MAKPPGPWGDLYNTIFANLQGDGLGGAQTGALAFVAVHDTVANGVSWLGLALEQRLASPTGAIVQGVAAPVNAARDALLTDAAAKFGTLHQQLVDIAGGAGNVDALLPDLHAIAVSLQALLAEEERHPPDADAPAIDDLNATVADAARVSQKQLQPLLEAFNVSPELEAAVDEALAGFGGQWQRTALTKLLKVALSALGTIAPILAPALIAEAIEHFPEVAARFGEFGELAGRHIAEGINALHRPMEAVVETGAATILRQLRDEMFSIGASTPENVDATAARLLAIAGGFGMSAHLVSIAAEKIVSAKHLGFPQLAAYLADAASFGKISNNSVGVQIEAALRSPARRRALAQFRPELPDTGTFLEMLFARTVDDVEAKEHFRQHGLTEDVIARAIPAMFRKASPREMAMVFEDGEIDEAWGLKMLQRHGFNDEDADRLLRGVITRANKTVRQAALAAIVANAEDGVYDVGQAAELLRELGLSERGVQLNLAVANHKRLNTEVKERIAALVSAHTQGTTTDEELSANFAALGLDQRAINHHMYVARIKRGAKVFTATAAQSQASENRARREATDAALAAFQRFQLDEAGLENTLLAIGVNDQEAAALVQLAAVRREPTVKLEEVLSAGAEAERERKVQTEGVLELQRKGAITQEEATARITALGVPRALASSEAALVAARLLPTPAVPKAPAATELARERQRILDEGAFELFRAGLSSQGALRASLIRNGHDAATADAIVAREADRLAVAQLRTSRQSAEAEHRKEQAAITREAVTAFRADVIDADGLEQTLVAAGVSAAVAASTRRREEDRAAGTDQREAEQQATTEAARVLKANQDADVLAFRHGIIDADELEQQLVDDGTDPALAASMRRREELRATPTPRAPRLPVVSEPAP